MTDECIIFVEEATPYKVSFLDSKILHNAQLKWEPMEKINPAFLYLKHFCH
jgi:hypothetical protein